jgi:hypothetical protein
MLFRRLPAAKKQMPVHSGHWFDCDPWALVMLVLANHGIRTGRLAASAYIPFHAQALHVPAYMARACEIVLADAGRACPQYTAALQHMPDHQCRR